ncbi:MAG TPA: putative sporulation protein YtxC [Clostridiaceae bacterium]|nr:putative sporulation protein YtxC [Clostridiaceae bacterium]
MQFLCIGVNERAEDVKQQIAKELQSLKNNKIDFSIDEVDAGGSTSIICKLDNDRHMKEENPSNFDIFRKHVSNALAHFIIKQYEEKLLERIINTNYCYFNAPEKKEIVKNAMRIINNEERNFLSGLFRVRRYNTIVKRLIDYFESSNNLILEGFVNFRLKEYMKELEDIVDKAVDDYLMQREYKEFIKLLRYFVDIQEPKFEVIHIIADYDGKYILLDDSKQEITKECIKEFASEISQGEVNYDDLLVSSLITLAPEKVIIHCLSQFKNKELFETIKNVFTGKIVICNGCEICLLNIIKKQNS